MSFTAVILAAGKGTRMKSGTPKVLHPVCGRPMIAYPIDAARKAGAKDIVIVLGYGAAEVRKVLSDDDISVVIQEEQLGTGHAVMVAEGAVSRALPVVIMCGDAPLIRSSTIHGLLESHKKEKNSVTVLTAELRDPSGYGRIVKDGDEILRIVEEKDASAEEDKIREINSGVYCADGRFLFEALLAVGRGNTQGEYYLTDIVGIGRDSGGKAGWSKISDNNEIMGINSRKELAVANGIMRRRILEALMENGVTVVDPDCTYADYGVKVGRDSVIYPQVRLEGDTDAGARVIIETGAVIRNSVIREGAHIKPYSIITDSEVGEDAAIGPFAHLRPGSMVGKRARVGNFVEMKKSTLGEGSKANHLTYIGDTEVGRDVNIGAGTVTCNYDGYSKFRTVIGNGAFIGSGTNLVAPLSIGKEAVVGAGSTITRDVPSDSLSLTRPEQRTIEGWARKRKEAGQEK